MCTDARAAVLRRFAGRTTSVTSNPRLPFDEEDGGSNANGGPGVDGGSNKTRPTYPSRADETRTTYVGRVLLDQASGVPVRSVRLSASAPEVHEGATARPSRSGKREGWQLADRDARRCAADPLQNVVLEASAG